MPVPTPGGLAPPLLAQPRARQLDGGRSVHQHAFLNGNVRPSCPLGAMRLREAAESPLHFARARLPD
eukprot:5309335-Pyramimonas_sp.AAC.1